jgi:hypothetical protein
MSAWFKPMRWVLIAAKHWRHSAPWRPHFQISSWGRWSGFVLKADSVLILGDIPPAAAELADRVDAPLVWMSNFGWDEIYRPLGVAFERWADAALAQYKRGQLLLRCPFDLSMNWGLQELALGLVCTRPRPLPSDWQRAMSSLDQTLVLVGFGGLGLQLDPELVPRWPRHHFLMASPAQAATSARSPTSSKSQPFFQAPCGLSMPFRCVLDTWVSLASARFVRRWIRVLVSMWWSVAILRRWRL